MLPAPVRLLLVIEGIPNRGSRLVGSFTRPLKRRKEQVELRQETQLAHFKAVKMLLIYSQDKDYTRGLGPN